MWTYDYEKVEIYNKNKAKIPKREHLYKFYFPLTSIYEIGMEASLEESDTHLTDFFNSKFVVYIQICSKFVQY